MSDNFPINTLITIDLLFKFVGCVEFAFKESLQCFSLYRYSEGNQILYSFNGIHDELSSSSNRPSFVFHKAPVGLTLRCKEGDAGGAKNASCLFSVLTCEARNDLSLSSKIERMWAMPRHSQRENSGRRRRLLSTQTTASKIQLPYSPNRPQNVHTVDLLKTANRWEKHLILKYQIFDLICDQIIID